jgi:hypothetical protein
MNANEIIDLATQILKAARPLDKKDPTTSYMSFLYISSMFMLHFFGMKVNHEYQVRIMKVMNEAAGNEVIKIKKEASERN